MNKDLKSSSVLNCNQQTDLNVGAVSISRASVLSANAVS